MVIHFAVLITLFCAFIGAFPCTCHLCDNDRDGGAHTATVLALWARDLRMDRKEAFGMFIGQAAADSSLYLGWSTVLSRVGADIIPGFAEEGNNPGCSTFPADMSAGESFDQPPDDFRKYPETFSGRFGFNHHL